MLLGVGLAMDAFSVSMANAMRDPHMKRREMVRIAGAFALFQFLMPEIGWICVHTIVNYFSILFQVVSETYSLDCPDSSCIYRRQDAFGGNIGLLVDAQCNKFGAFMSEGG